jgi:hypothetical protein
MTESEVIDVVRQHLEGKFPKKCSVCDRTYANLKDYLLHTKHVGPPKSYDADLGIFQPTEPIGTMSLANCSCGNTLVLDCSGMNQMTLWKLLGWLCGEMIRRRQKASAVLEDLRGSVDRATLADSPPAVHRLTVISADSFPSAPLADSSSESS